MLFRKKKNEKDYYTSGLEKYDAKEYQLAMEFFQAALDNNPDNEDVLRMLANTYGKVGKSELQKQTLAKIKKSESINQPTLTVPHNNIPNKRKKNISKDDYFLFFRLILYGITVFNVIQLLSAITYVTTWGVWSWDDLFEFIGNFIGVIGVAIGILLPAYGVACLLYMIEKNPSINHKKTNVVFIILNIAAIFALCKLSDNRLRLWSWYHLWIILRPVVFIIAGIIAIGLALLLLWLIAKAFIYIGEKISKFFTT